MITYISQTVIAKQFAIVHRDVDASCVHEKSVTCHTYRKGSQRSIAYADRPCECSLFTVSLFKVMHMFIDS